jgi:predicted GH43/DUF377 family glycosyl hydrolase
MNPKNLGTAATLTVAVLIALAGCSASTADLQPLAWQKVPGPGPGGALLGLDGPGTFDERANFTVSAFKDAGVYYLYYGGSDATGACAGINGSHWRVGLAQSTDGVNWTRVPGVETGGAILDVGSPGQFDEFLAYRPFVLKDGTVFRMWYNGSTEPFNCPTGTLALNRRIGYADSSDGIHWTKHYDGAGPGGSVLPLGAADAIDGQQVGYVWVLKDGAQYKMYYSANDSGNFWRVGLAVSSDARTWTKVPGKLANGSVLDLGPAGSFDAACAYQPSVVKERENLYRMWYRACASPGRFGGPSGGVIGYAESNDGITWVKIPQPGPSGEALGPGAAGQFDSGGLTTPSVFIDGNGWAMYYAGFDTAGQFLSGLARAP